MSDHPRPTRVSRLLSRCYPRELREQYADDIARFIDDARHDPRNRNNPFSALRVAAGLTKDALLSLAASWRNDAPRPLRRWESDTSVIATFRSISMETLLQDIRIAVRGFVRRPAFTVVALLTLTLGIGGNSAIFTLVNAVLLTPLPFENPEQLVDVWGANEKGDREMLSIPNFEDFRTRARVFSELGIVRTQSVNLTGGERPDRVIGNFVSASSLRMLNARLALGRLFTDEETQIGTGQPVVVLSYDTWQTRFGGRTDMVGQTLVLNGKPHAVIGVTAQAFRDPTVTDVWLPISLAPSKSWFNRANATVSGRGRLKPGFTAADGQRELTRIAKELAKENGVPTASANALVTDMREGLIGGSRFMIKVLFGAVVAVLLIVCVNIANLQLVRASGRRREMSVRAALGANRGRLISQTLTESLVLSLAGGACGVAVGQAAVKMLVAAMPNSFPLIGTLQLDANVWIFSLGMALLTGLLFGMPAALSGTKFDLQSALRARTEPASAGRFNLRNILVVSELSLCIVLLAVAGLFTRSLQSLHDVDQGFNEQQVLTAEFRLPSIKYDDELKVRNFMTAVTKQLRSTPGVRSAALVDAVPFSGNSGTIGYVAQGQTEPAPGTAPNAQITAVTDDYFKTLEIKQLAGRDFESHDIAGSEPVIIVNKAFADAVWPKENAIGKTVRLLNTPEISATVIGVVANTKQFTMTEVMKPQIYASKDQNTGIFASVVLRVTGDPDAMSNTLRQAIWAVDRDQPVWKVRSLASLVDRDIGPSNVAVGIIGTFALVALLLGTIGVYGVMSFSVQQRSREMGIRLALGARGDQIVKMVLGNGMEVVIIAVIIGVGGALAAGRFVQSRLYNVGATDPATMIGVPLVLAGVALLACWWPARRAAQVDPAVTLRSE